MEKLLMSTIASFFGSLLVLKLHFSLGKERTPNGSLFIPFAIESPQGDDEHNDARYCKSPFHIEI